MGKTFDLSKLHPRQEEMINLKLAEAMPGFELSFTRGVCPPIEFLKNFLVRNVVQLGWEIRLQIKMLDGKLVYYLFIHHRSQGNIGVTSTREQEVWAMGVALACGHKINFDDLA